MVGSLFFEGKEIATNIFMKSLITLNEFQEYNNYYEENMTSTCQIFIDSASAIVADYIGYDPNEQDYEEIIEGIGSDKLYTAIPHISEFSYVMDIEKEEMLNNLVANEDYIYERDGKEVFKEGKKYKVSYSGGWKTIPSDIKFACLRISALALQESNGNIGLSGKSFVDQSRSFVSYSSYDKYLKPLLPYRSKAIL